MRKLMVVFAAVIAACSADDRSSVVVDTVGGEVEAVEGQGSLIVTLAEGRLDSPVDTLVAGRYTFRVENTGKEKHGLEVEGNGRDWETGDLAPGSSSEITVDLTPGVYELSCPVESHGKEHDELGMKRKLVVRP